MSRQTALGLGRGSERHGGIEKIKGKKGENYGHGQQCGDFVMKGGCEVEDALEGIKVMEN